MTKKSIIFTILIVSFTVGIILLLSQEKEDSTTEQKEITFSYDQVEDITRIFFANKRGKYIDLKKGSDGIWMVNGTDLAWEKKVRFLLDETFKKVKVKGTAPKPARDKIIKEMAISGIKVELYTNNSDKPEMEYYIGGTTPTQTGTYFWMEGAHTPYVTYVPGFTGYLNSRFDLDFNNWVSRSIFSYEPDEIESIQVRKNQDSFTVKRNNDEFGVYQNEQPVNSEPNAVLSFVKQFRGLNMESILTLNDNKRDSILNSQPFASIMVLSKKGKTKKMNMYLKKSHKKMHELHTQDGKELTTDPNRFYANIEGSNRIMIVQDYTFGKILRRAQDFK